MRRTMIMASLVGFALTVAGFSTPTVQTPGGTSSTTLRRIQVNAQTIAALPSDKKYVVDLTQRGVRYEFDAKRSQIDFSRVMVRTARGEVTIGSFLEKIIPKDKFAGFKYSSQSFSLGTRLPGTVQTPLTNPSKLIDCASSDYCVCEGEIDCEDLLNSRLCGGASFCGQGPNQEVRCACRRSP